MLGWCEQRDVVQNALAEENPFSGQAIDVWRFDVGVTGITQGIPA